MADKRISQLIERTDIANNDVLPIVASGATTTNKVTISTIQDWMQDNLDVGVTSVGITLGTTGTDVNVSGSPITTSGNITINIPDASTSARGVVTTGSQTFAGNKSFQNTIFVNAGLRLDQNGTALPTFVQNISGTGLISSGSNGLGFNSANNLYFSGSEKGGAVLAVNNTAVRTYTLQDANGTLAFTSDLTGYVTLGTAQTITAQKTFSTSGSSDTAIINHGSGSGIALNITKAGNGEGLRVAKTSGSGNAVTITGGTLSAEAGQFSGDLQTSTRISATSGSNAITITPNVGGTQNRIETTGTLPLSLVSAAAITMAAGGTTPQITLATTGNVGIGTSSPSVASGLGLVLNGQAGQTRLAFKNTFTGDSSGDGVQFALINGSSGFVFQNRESDGYFSFETNGTERLNIASTGAATFSSSVTAVDGTDNNLYAALIHKNVTGGGNSGLRVHTNGTDAGAGAYAFRVTSGNTVGSPTNTIINALVNGNVGIGTASPASYSRLQVKVGTNFNLAVGQDSGAVGIGAYNDALSANANLNITASNIIFSSGGERMRITSGGNVLFNCQSAPSASVEGFIINGTSSGNGSSSGASTAAYNHLLFYNGNGIVGSISTAALLTSYTTTSDYRLKEDLQQIKGLEVLSAIKVYNYKWKSEDSRMDGVLAHELAEVLPYAVTGEKDEVNEDGTEKMQGVDYSKIVPILIKAIQEQQEQINSLKNQIK
jgi:hypothetical protein